MMQTMPNYGGKVDLPEDQIAFGPQNDGPLNPGKMTDGVSISACDLICSLDNHPFHQIRRRNSYGRRWKISKRKWIFSINQIIKMSYSRCSLETNAQTNLSQFTKEFTLRDQEPPPTQALFASTWDTTLIFKLLSLATSHQWSQLPP